MSVRDADLYEALLHRLAGLRGDRPLRVVEWGAGRSTCWYTKYLDELGTPYRWLALEHDRGFFESRIAPETRTRTNWQVVRAEHLTPEAVTAFSEATGVLAVVFDAGQLFPFGAGREQDRLADLDDYVALPHTMGIRPDLAVIDGRKRRRCVLEAATLVAPGGYVILHDAWRRHYQCAWTAFRSGARFGDEWWIGSHALTDFRDVLPWHAFERHTEPDATTATSSPGDEQPAELVRDQNSPPLRTSRP